MESNTQRQVKSIDPSDIDSWFFERSQDPNPEDLEELASSMADRQEDTITVRETDDGLQGVTGYRRVAAVSQFGDEYGIESVLAEVADLDDMACLRARMAENEHRRDDSPIDQAHMVQTAYEHFGNLSDTADHFSKSVPWVSKKRKLLDMDEETQEAVDEGQMSENTATAVEQVEDDEVKEQLREEAATEGLSEKEVHDRIDELEASQTHVQQLADALETIRNQHSKVEEHSSKEEEYRDLQSRIESLDSDIDDFWDVAPEQVQETVEELQDMQDKRDALEAAIESVEDKQDQLREAAESEKLSSDEGDRAATLTRQVSELEEKIGDDPTVTTSDNDSGTRTVSIHVTFDPDDPPALIEEYLELYEQYEDATSERATLEKRKQRSAQFEKAATEMPNNLTHFLRHTDMADLDDPVRRAIERAAEKDAGLKGIRKSLDEVEETISDDFDQERLEELQDELGDKREEYEALKTEKQTLKQKAKGLRSAPSNRTRAENQRDDAIERAQEAFDRLDPEDQAIQLDRFSEVYDFPLDFLADDADADTSDEEDAPDVAVEEQGGGWYVVRSGDQELKVQGKDTADEVADTWKTDGFDAADSLAA